MDSDKVYQSLLDFPKQCQQVIAETSQLSLPDECEQVKNIVVSGMGGSALGGRVIKYLERSSLNVPITISTEYDLPYFVNEHTLVIISSYSGNTEETLSALSEAVNRRAKIFVITTGGELSKITKENGLSCYLIDPKYNSSQQPRMGLGYNILSIICVLNHCRLIKTPENLDGLAAYLTDKMSDVKTYEELASKLTNKIPVLVASEHLKGALHCIRNQINETSKNFAVYFDLPELNHHLLEGLAHPPSNTDNLHFIFFTSRFYQSVISRRYPVTADVLQKQQINYSQVDLAGPSRFYETLEMVQMGGFAAYFISRNNHVDPGIIPWVEYFKKSFSSSV